MQFKSLISMEEPKAPASEAYRMLKTNLQYFNFTDFNQVFVVTSSVTKEGKTTTTANLGITLAQSDAKVLLIDCDLRKPRLHKLFNLSNAQGLTSVFKKEKAIGEVIQHFDKVNNLDIITSGEIPPMPLELLESHAMSQILETLKDVYDYILIDAPPLLSAADACVLSKKSDGVILVVGANNSKIPEIKTAISSLQKVDAKILGTILTQVDSNKNNNYHYNYNYSL